MRRLSTHGLIIGATIAAIIALFVFVDPIAQDPAYHRFADDRRLFGVANFWNVISNLPFLVVGALGITFVLRHRGVTPAGLESSYIVFFIGVLLTAFGSAWYHLAPGNASLVWDRLPMTIGFAGFFALLVGEFISPAAGRRLLVPMLFAGVLAVEYWAWTETRGAGDLRPYAVVALLPMLLIVLILVLYGAKSAAQRYFWLMMVFYVLAKLAEHFDAGIYAAGELFSGHSLKHLFAAMTPATLLYLLQQRRRAHTDNDDD